MSFIKIKKKIKIKIKCRKYHPVIFKESQKLAPHFFRNNNKKARISIIILFLEDLANALVSLAKKNFLSYYSFANTTCVLLTFLKDNTFCAKYIFSSPLLRFFCKNLHIKTWLNKLKQSTQNFIKKVFNNKEK